MSTRGSSSRSASTCPIATPTWTLAVDREADRAVDALLGEVGLGGRPRIVGLHIGAAFGPSKLWPAESFARLAAQLAGAHLAPLLLGSPADRETADAVIAASRRAAAPPSSGGTGPRSCRGSSRGCRVS